MKISVQADMRSKKWGIFHQKTPKSTHLKSIQFWNPIAKVSVTLQYEKTSNRNLTHRRWRKASQFKYDQSEKTIYHKLGLILSFRTFIELW